MLQWATPCLRPHSIFSITRSQYLLQGKPLDDDEINSKVKSCFSQCDLNCDGKISEDEFFKASRTVAEMFELEGDGGREVNRKQPFATCRKKVKKKL